MNFSFQLTKEFKHSKSVKVEHQHSGSKAAKDFQGIQGFSIKRYLSYDMASSSSIPKLIAKPIIVEIVKRPRPVFKIIPKIAKLDDSIGAFSKISKGVSFTKDPRAYIHCNIGDLGSEDLKNMFINDIVDNQGIVKLKHKIVEDLGFIDILHMHELSDDII